MAPARFKPHALILGFLLVLTFSMRTALKPRYALERRAIEDKAREERVQQVAKVWNALCTTNAAPGRVLPIIQQQIDRGLTNLSILQTTRLKNRLRELLGYLQEPSLTEYLRLKTEGLTFHFRLSEAAKQYLQGTLALSNASATPRESPGPILSSLWANMHRKSGASKISRITAISSNNIAIVSSSDGSVRALLDGPVGKGFTMGHVALDPGFRYRPSQEAHRGQPETNLFAHLSFYARSNMSTNAGPVHISLYWSKRDKKWALGKMTSDLLLNIEFLF